MGFDALLDLSQKEAAGRNKRPFRCEWRKAGGYQVSIDETGAARHLG